MLLPEYLLLYYYYLSILSSSYYLYFMLYFHFMHNLSLMSYYMHYRNLFTMLLSHLLNMHIPYLMLSYHLSIITPSNLLYLLSSLLITMLYLLLLVYLLYSCYSMLYLMLMFWSSHDSLHYKSSLHSSCYIPHNMLVLCYTLALHFMLMPLHILLLMHLYHPYITMPSNYLHYMALLNLSLSHLSLLLDYSTVSDYYSLPYLFHNIHLSSY